MNPESKAAKMARKSKGEDFNEFYTLYEEADKFLTPYLEHISKAKTIYCPCDSEESNIVKWLKEHCTAKIEYQYEKDFNSDEVRAEMLKADIIITNPPFRCKVFNPFVRWLLDNKKDFILWCPNDGRFFNEVYYFDFHRGNMHPYLIKRGEIKYAMSKVMSTFRVLHNLKPTKEYDISHMPFTAIWYFNKDEYELLDGNVSYPGEYARCALRRKYI